MPDPAQPCLQDIQSIQLFRMQHQSTQALGMQAGTYLCMAHNAGTLTPSLKRLYGVTISRYACKYKYLNTERSFMLTIVVLMFCRIEGFEMSTG